MNDAAKPPRLLRRDRSKAPGGLATRWLTPAEAVERLGVSEETLRQWRVTGRGVRCWVMNGRGLLYYEREVVTFWGRPHPIRTSLRHLRRRF